MSKWHFANLDLQREYINISPISIASFLYDKGKQFSPRSDPAFTVSLQNTLIKIEKGKKSTQQP